MGNDEDALGRAACSWIARHLPDASAVLLPPPVPLLPLVVGRLEPPADRGASPVVLLPRIDRAFYNTLAGGASFCLSTPLYLLPRIVRAASHGEAIALVATALAAPIGARAPELLSGRGLAARFEIHHVPDALEEPVPAPDDLEGRLEKLEKGGVAPEPFLEVGLMTQDPVLRERAYRAAVAVAPDNAIAHLCLASSQSERERLPEAMAELREALRLDPDLDAAHYELAKLQIRTDDMPGALASFHRTTELLPDFASAWTNLGAALGETGRLDEAAAALGRAANLDPRSHALHSNLGVTLRNLGRYGEAEREFQRALELAPDFLFGRYNLAYNYYLQGCYPQAIALFEKARDEDLRKTPRQGMLLALARLASGDIEGAQRDYRAILEALDQQSRKDMISVAEWDLKGLEKARPEDAAVRETLALVLGME